MTFAQRQNRLTPFSERNPVVKRRISLITYQTARCPNMVGQFDELFDKCHAKKLSIAKITQPAGLADS